ncbi:hypothetical protein FRY98_15895 [Paenibacillus faecis]|uniref:Uncharacterized protein n=1 Tax=Paenibacillus faecis TaxID=862114 RepID=A0A5D0CQQ2_9BACL|nr:hypothetical protein [Paenibacillus faecis]TYA12193.1 hypothetical protein FRY98_15895 [Paenibacillus faecis]
MAKMDWKNSDVVKAEDMNQIGREINLLHTEWKDRLDTADTDPVTLQPGVQMVHAAKDARFRLGEMKGRTLINVLGDSGSCDSLQGWSDTGRFTIDTTNKVEGSASIKGTLLTGDPYVDLNQIIRYQPSKFYVAVGEVKVPSGVQARLRMVESERPETERASEVILSSTGDKFKTLFFKVPQNAFSESGTVYFGAVFVGSQGSTGNVDALRIYEISASEYDSLNKMTAEQVAAKYPFVPSGIVGVENPYVIGTSDNLLPPFYEWTDYGTGNKVISPYQGMIAASSENFAFGYRLPCLPNRTYTISAAHNGVMALQTSDADGNPLNLNGSYQQVQQLSITTTTNDKFINVLLSNGSLSVGTYTFKNPMLTLGTVPKPFLPQRKSMLAFQTELHANPTDGSDPDVLFERDGQYFKLAKWKKMNLDGSLNWAFLDGAVDGLSKRVSFVNALDIAAMNYGFLTKYDGKRLVTNVETYGNPDSFAVSSSGATLCIANTDSGWGSSYTPTADEIKAYFMGWKMTIQGSSTGIEPYNNSGNKVWVNILSWDGTKFFMLGATTTLPTQVSDVNYVPYQLLYRLVKDTVESVVSEGSLTLTEGENKVEVGTGIVLRERANPVSNGPDYNVNNTELPSSILKHKTGKILSLYKNNLMDDRWSVFTWDAPYGLEGLYTSAANFDPTAAYSVTYIKLDKSPIQPITGTLGANEKAQISDLTAGVAEALHRVSVVEQKKADEDTPSSAWITPTLLNGATPYGPYTPQYMKKDGRVYLRGEAVLTALGVPVFRLPEGYRPDRRPRFIGYSFSTQVVPGEIIVTETGEVTILSGGLSAVSFDGVSFLAK